VHMAEHNSVLKL